MLLKWQFDLKGGALSNNAVNANLTAMSFNKLFCDRQPQTKTPRLPRLLCIHPIEPFKNMEQIGLMNPNTTV